METEVVAASSSEFQFKVNIPSDLSSLFEETDADSTRLLYTVTLVGMPPGGNVELVSAVGHQPNLIASDENQGSTLNQAPHPLARILPPFRVRGRQLAPLRIYPVSGQTIYGQVEVRLRFHGGQGGGATPTDDPAFDRLFKATVANHQQLNQWPAEVRPAAKGTASNPFTATSDWYKIEVDQSGLYRVTGNQLRSAGMNLNGLNSDDLHLYNGGGRQLEVPNHLPRPEFREVAILVEDGGDGIFERDDYILFYGESVNRWRYGPFDSVGYHHHHYTEHNVYWLTASSALGSAGLRMSTVTGAPDGLEDTVFTSYVRNVHSERDTIFSRDNSDHLRDYYRWYWTDDKEPSFYVAASNVVIGHPADARIVASLPWSTDSYGLRVAGDAATLVSCDDSSCTFTAENLREGLNQFRIDYNIGGTSLPYLDKVDVSYLSYLAPLNDRLEFNLGSYSGRARIKLIDDFESEPMILDIRSPRQPRQVTGYLSDGGMISFAAELTEAGPNLFYAQPPSQASDPASITRTTSTDLRTPENQVDLIIITPDAFTDAMKEYTDYREAQGVNIRVVALEDVMDNFAYGLFDPTAIRDFLKFAYEQYPSPAPATVLLVGDGHYDYLNHLGHDAPNLIPPYIHGRDVSFTYSDDNYVYFGNYGYLDSDSSYAPEADRGLDMVSARWTVQDAAEIKTIIDKSKRYESSSGFGLWRNKIALVADDEFAGGRTNELIHTGQTDTLQMRHLPAQYLRDKIYAIEFPFVNSQKPALNDAIVDAFNSGRLVVNYVGHGNPGLWAHERIFTVNDDLPRLANYARLPLVLAASCAIGAFDSPSGSAMAEDLIAHQNGGAIAVISATRLVWSTPNKEFNQTVFDVLFGPEKLTMCEAMYTAKLLHQLWAGGPTSLTNNDRAFLFIGDPLLKLARPTLEIRYSTAPDSLIALQRSRVSGEVIDDQGNTVSSDGLLSVLVYDSDKARSYNSAEHGGTGGTITYSVDGAVIYRGSAAIENGHFDFEFMPPLDIGFGGRSARVMAYATLDTVDGAGVVDSIYVTDSIANVTDSVGPAIVYRLADRSGFVSGDPIFPGDRLEISLSDPSGINLTGGLGHGVTLEIDERSDKMVNLTGGFEYVTGGFTDGSVGYSPDSLTVGLHTFKIKAWDNANNSSTLEFAAEVMAADGPAVTELLNFPNPMRESTRFSFYAARHLESFSLELFTLSGRKIKSYSLNSLSPGPHDEIEWRGEDFAGDRVATGVYIYKATARSTDDHGQVEMFGKVVVIN